MTKKYLYSFHILLIVLVLMEPINCGHVPPRRDSYTSETSRRQGGHPGGPPGGPGGPPPGGPPGGPPPGGQPDEPPPGGPADEPDGEPSGGPPKRPPRPAEQPVNPDRPKPPEGEEATEDPDEANSEKPIQTVKVTDLPQEAVDDALILDYGRYTTLSFHYESKQWMFSPKLDVCYDDYTKCYTSLVAPIPICMMYSTRNIQHQHSYCDAYFFNCRLGYRYWRVVGYGKCIVAFFGFPHLEDTMHRRLG